MILPQIHNHAQTQIHVYKYTVWWAEINERTGGRSEFQKMIGRRERRATAAERRHCTEKCGGDDRDLINFFNFALFKIVVVNFVKAKVC